VSTAPHPGPALLGIHHFTIRCAPAALDDVRDFYCEVLGMRIGPRPDFPFSGYWLYAGDTAVVHLAAIVDGAWPREPGPPGPGFDHVSLRARGLDRTRRWLHERAIAFEELPVPRWPLQQIFLRDPTGSKIELTFELPE
jgi:catechol 2,3-dioxygenase-like lactoylglutathione lyase family enzyme